MDTLMFLPVLAAAFIFGFSVGRGVTKNPSEETMLERLIIARTERLMIGITKKNIEDEIVTESDRRAHSVAHS